MQKRLLTTAATFIAVGLAATTTPVFAQGATNSQSAGNGTAMKSDAAQVSQTDIQKFAKAQEHMQSLVRDSQEQIADAEDQKQAQQYRQKMNDKIIKTIKKDGLSVQKYNQIAQASRNDPQLQQRIQKAMKN